MTTKEREQLTHAEQNAEAWVDSIAAAHEAYGFCAEEGEGRLLSREAKAILKEHGYDGTNHDTVAEWIEDAMREAPLSVEVRSGWHCPGEGASMEPDEYRILLSTGGPALRITGSLNSWCEPADAELQHQDWGTGWIEWRQVDYYSLLWFASLFHYGEG